MTVSLKTLEILRMTLSCGRVFGAAYAALPPAVIQPCKLLDRLLDHLRTRHASSRTEAAYMAWARRFILFHGKHHSTRCSPLTGWRNGGGGQ